MTKDRLKAAPNFDKDQWPLIGDSKWLEKTHTYYSVEPSWTESGTGGWGRESPMVRDWPHGGDPWPIWKYPNGTPMGSIIKSTEMGSTHSGGGT